MTLGTEEIFRIDNPNYSFPPTPDEGGRAGAWLKDRSGWNRVKNHVVTVAVRSLRSGAHE